MKHVIFKLFLALLPGLCTVAHAMTNQITDSKVLALKAQKKVQTEHNAYPADPTISAIIEHALNTAGITRTIVPLQTETTDNAFVSTELSLSPQEFMIIGIKNKSLDQITAAIYHEVGHVVYEDCSLNAENASHQLTIRQLQLAILIAVATSALISRTCGLSLAKSIAISALTGLASLLSSVFYTQHQKSLIEARADRFAYEHLLKNNLLHIALTKLADHLARYEYEFARIPAIFSGYPDELQRAKIGLEVLVKQGINITTLMENLPNDLDEGIKSKLPDAVRKWFPSKIMSQK